MTGLLSDSRAQKCTSEDVLNNVLQTHCSFPSKNKLASLFYKLLYVNYMPEYFTLNKVKFTQVIFSKNAYYSKNILLWRPTLHVGNSFNTGGQYSELPK